MDSIGFNQIIYMERIMYVDKSLFGNYIVLV